MEQSKGEMTPGDVEMVKSDKEISGTAEEDGRSNDSKQEGYQGPPENRTAGLEVATPLIRPD
jgi:hypothetical protein